MLLAPLDVKSSWEHTSTTGQSKSESGYRLYNVVCRKPDANWGSSADALTFINAMKSTQELTDNPDHIKNYRPKILALTGWNKVSRQE